MVKIIIIIFIYYNCNECVLMSACCPQLISSVVTQNWCNIVQSCELENWKEALAALLTYANPEEFASLCGEIMPRVAAHINGSLSL